jgi:dimethylsulfoniopropionate demethylase
MGPRLLHAQYLFLYTQKNRFQIGNITSGIYSPFLKTNIGLSMVDRDYWNDGQDVIVLTPDNIERKGKVCSLPFNYS